MTEASGGGKMDIELEKFKLEQKKFELEQEKFAHSTELDKRKIKAENWSRFWSQFSIFVPLLLLLTGFFINTYSDSVKVERNKREELRKEELGVIDKQLTEFFYPLQQYLQTDNVIDVLWEQRKDSLTDRKLADEVQKDIVPNSTRILDLISSKFYLIKNSYEDAKIDALLKSIDQYQRYATASKALRNTKDERNPVDLSDEYQYPAGINSLIAARITELEKRRKELVEMKEPQHLWGALL
jgi:hypothetical protein